LIENIDDIINKKETNNEEPNPLKYTHINQILFYYKKGNNFDKYELD